MRHSVPLRESAQLLISDVRILADYFVPRVQYQLTFAENVSKVPLNNHLEKLNRIPVSSAKLVLLLRTRARNTELPRQRCRPVQPASIRQTAPPCHARRIQRTLGQVAFDNPAAQERGQPYWDVLGLEGRLRRI